MERDNRLLIRLISLLLVFMPLLSPAQLKRTITKAQIEDSLGTAPGILPLPEKTIIYKEAGAGNHPKSAATPGKQIIYSEDLRGNTNVKPVRKIIYAEREESSLPGTSAKRQLVYAPSVAISENPPGQESERKLVFGNDAAIALEMNKGAITNPENSPPRVQPLLSQLLNSNCPQFIASANNIVPTTCPRSAAGYANNGSFTISVADGSCTGTYTVNATPVAGSAPNGSTPTLTTTTTYIGFQEDNFFFGSAGAGQYLVTITNTSGNCATVQNPVTLTVTMPEGSPSAACDIQNPGQFTATANNVVGTTCPRSSTGYANNGSFSIAVADGPCTGAYTVNATPVAGSAPNGGTPTPTTITTYIGFNEGNFFFGSAGAGQYLVTITNTSGNCATVQNPVTLTVTVQEGSPSAACDIQNPGQFTATANSIVGTTCPRSSAGYANNGSFSIAVADGPCTGAYTVNATPVAGSAPNGGTPTPTTITTYIGFTERNFFFGSAGAGQYLVTITNTSGNCATVQNPVTLTVTIPEGSPSAACDIQNPGQFTATANSVIGTTCPRSSAGYANNGSFSIAVADGPCTGAYTVNATPVAGSAPNGGTPTPTTITTYIGFTERNFFFGSAGAGQYLVTITNTSGNCATVQNPVTLTVTIPEGSPSAACDIQNPGQFTATANSVIGTTCPRSSAGYANNGSFSIAVADGPCTGAYTVNATPVAGSAPNGGTPTPTTITTYIGFPEGNFFFESAGAGQYLVTITNTSGNCATVQNPVTLTVTVPEGSPSAACDIQNPGQFKATANSIVGTTCPRSGVGYVNNGSFSIAVADGSCTGAYTVNATPVAGSAPNGGTPTPTTITTYIGFPEGKFFFESAGAGQYLVTITNTSGNCATVQNPVTLTVTVPEGSAPQVNPVDNVTVCPGQQTEAISFTSSTPGTSFYWSNSNTAIGLAASGVGTIPAFVAQNPGVDPLTATITVTAVYDQNGCLCIGQSTTFTITVGDNLAPVITDVSVTPDVLFPPNRQMEPVNISYSVSDNEKVTTTLTVTSNEPINGPGNSGGMEPDWEIINDHQLLLRAERLGTGNGRIYTITITSVDACGNTSSKEVQVTVPKAKNMLVQNISTLIRPNPSHSDFFVTINSSKKSEPIFITVTDFVGRVIETRRVPEGQLFQLGQRYPKGMYLMKVRQGETVQDYSLLKIAD